MTVGELRAALAKSDATQDVTILVNSIHTPVVEVVVVPGAEMIILRGKNAAPPRQKLSINEQGLVGYLVRLGLDNDGIGRVLGRPAKSVERARKGLGF
jgi:hypothetical protein